MKTNNMDGSPGNTAERTPALYDSDAPHRPGSQHQASRTQSWIPAPPGPPAVGTPTPAHWSAGCAMRHLSLPLILCLRRSSEEEAM